MDYDSAELHGCCDALRKMCGGTREIHMERMMIGCSVHLVRDLDRKTRNEDMQKKSGMGQRGLWKVYNAFVKADSREAAEIALEKIRSFDEDWVTWVRSNEMGPVISHALSRMDPTSRSLGFRTTNTVESQNRRGNVLAGTYLRPSEAARNLWDVDRVDVKNLAGGVFNHIAKARGYRNRTDSILRPSGTSTLATRKRSKKAGGPAPLKKKRKASKTPGSMSTNTMENDGGQGAEGGIGTPGSREGHGRVSRDSYIPNLVQQQLTDLLGELSDMPVEGANLSAEEQEDKRDRRTDIIIDMLHGVNEAGRGNPSNVEHDFVKKILLDGMRMESVRQDKELRNAFVQLFRACMRPPSVQASGSAPGGAAGIRHGENARDSA